MLASTSRIASQTRFSVRTRCAPNSTGASTVTKPVEDVKIQTTLSTLDALLGDAAKPQQPTPAPTSSAPAQPDSQAGVFNWPTSTSKPATPAPTPAARKSKFSFENIMAFEGLAPEVINGRAAMIGFMAAIGAEFKTGESVFSQLLSGGFVSMLLVIAVVTAASFAPAIRQVPMDEVFNKNAKKIKEFGPFGVQAEISNGRAAMIGLALIILLEGTSGAAFFL